MSHYTDIGFKIEKNEDVVNTFNFINSNGKIKRLTWDLPSQNKDDNIVLTMFYIGEIRYSAKLNLKTNYILDIGLSHNNERICKAEHIGTLNAVNDESGFKVVQVEKDGIPFWFSCPNVEIFNIQDGKREELDLKIASFAENIEIKEKAPERKTENKQMTPEEVVEFVKENGIQMADESYIAFFNDDPTYAHVSGTIKDFKLEKNEITTVKYYAIDIDCLGLYFKVLVDPKLINKKKLKKGNILSSGYNTYKEPSVGR